MADKKISELTSLTSVDFSENSDQLPIVDSSLGITKRITAKTLMESKSFITVGDAFVGGNQAGNTRGSGALDIQAARDGDARVAGGELSIAIGSDCLASADKSYAIGRQNFVQATNSVAVGEQIDIKSTATESVVFGRDCQISGDRSVVLGQIVKVSSDSDRSVAIGRSVTVNDNADLVYAGCYEAVDIVPHDQVNGFQSSQLYEHSTYEFSKQNMIKCLPGPMPMWRKSIHKTVGDFDKNLKYAADWDFWLRAVRSGSKFLKFEKIMGIYYNNPKGLSTSKDNALERFQEERLVFNKNKDVFGNLVSGQFEQYFNEK